MTQDEYLYKRKRLVLEQDLMVLEAQQMQPQAVASGRPTPPEGGPEQYDDIDWRGGANMALQGLTFGTGDEIGILAAALVAKAATGDDFADIYMSMTEAEADERKEFRTKNPKTALGLEIAGGLTSGKGLFTIGQKLAKSAGTKISQVGARKRLQKALEGTSKKGATHNRKMEKRLTNILAATGVGGVEAFIYAFNSAQGGLEKRTDAGTKAAALGAAFGGGMSASAEAIKPVIEQFVKPRLAQALNKGEEFIPANVAAPSLKRSLPAAFMDTLVKNALGSKIPQQIETLRTRVQPDLDNAFVTANTAARQANQLAEAGQRVRKETGVNLAEQGEKNVRDAFTAGKREVEGVGDEARRSVLTKSAAQNREISQSATQQLRDTARTGDEMAEAGRMELQNSLFKQSAPPTATADELASLNHPDPQEAMKALLAMRKDKGFTALNGQQFDVNQKQLIDAALERNVNYPGLDKQSKAIEDEITSIVKNRISMSGQDLMAVRNQLRIRVNSGGTQPQAREAFRRAAEGIDKQIKARLDAIDPNLSKLYDAELAAYAAFRTTDKAMGNARQDAGRFTAEHVLSASGDKWGSNIGEATAQKEAQRVQQANAAIKARKEQQKIQTQGQKEQLSLDVKAAKDQELLTIAGTKQKALDAVTMQQAIANSLRKKQNRDFTAGEKQSRQPPVTARTAEKAEGDVRVPHPKFSAATDAEAVLKQRSEGPSNIFRSLAATYALPSLGAATLALSGEDGGIAQTLGGGLLSGVLASRGLSSQSVQRALMKDTAMQKTVAELLRRDPKAWGRGAVLRPGINQALDEEDEEQRRQAAY